MADIDVERKRGIPWWVWLLGLLALALLVWLIAEAMDGDEPEVVDAPVVAPVVAPEPATPAAAGVPPVVTAYLEQCTEEAGAPTGEMGLQHQFTVDCLQQLRESLNATIAQEQVASTDVSRRLEAYSGAVQQLQQSDPEAMTHANLTRDAAGTAAQLMASMQTAWFAGNAQVESAVREVQQAAEGIREGVPMLDQRESVHTFFREAGDAVRMMAESRTVQPPA